MRTLTGLSFFYGIVLGMFAQTVPDGRGTIELPADFASVARTRFYERHALNHRILHGRNQPGRTVMLPVWMSVYSNQARGWVLTRNGERRWEFNPPQSGVIFGIIDPDNRNRVRYPEWLTKRLAERRRQCNYFVSVPPPERLLPGQLPKDVRLTGEVQTFRKPLFLTSGVQAELTVVNLVGEYPGPIRGILASRGGDARYYGTFHDPRTANFPLHMWGSATFADRRLKHPVELAAYGGYGAECWGTDYDEERQVNEQDIRGMLDDMIFCVRQIVDELEMRQTGVARDHRLPDPIEPRRPVPPSFESRVLSPPPVPPPPPVIAEKPSPPPAEKIVRPERPDRSAADRLAAMIKILEPLETELQAGLIEIKTFSEAIKKQREEVLDWQRLLNGDNAINKDMVREELAKLRPLLEVMHKARDRQIEITLRLMDTAYRQVEELYNQGGWGELQVHADRVLRATRDRTDFLQGQVYLVSEKFRELFEFTAGLRSEMNGSAKAYFLEGMGHLQQGDALAALQKFRDARGWGMITDAEAARGPEGTRGFAATGSKVFNSVMSGETIEVLEREIEIRLIEAIQEKATGAREKFEGKFSAEMDSFAAVDRERGPIRVWLKRLLKTGLVDVTQGALDVVRERLSGDSSARAAEEEFVVVADEMAQTHIGLGVVKSLRKGGYRIEEIRRMDARAFQAAVEKTWEQTLKPEDVERLRRVMMSHGFGNPDMQDLSGGRDLTEPGVMSAELVKQIDNDSPWAKAGKWAGNMVDGWTVFTTLAPSAQLGRLAKFAKTPEATAATNVGEFFAASNAAKVAVARLEQSPLGRGALQAARGVQQFSESSGFRGARAWAYETAAKGLATYYAGEYLGEEAAMVLDLVDTTGASSSEFWSGAFEKFGSRPSQLQFAGERILKQVQAGRAGLQQAEGLAGRLRRALGKDSGGSPSVVELDALRREVSTMTPRPEGYADRLLAALDDATGGKPQSALEHLKGLERHISKSKPRIQSAEEMGNKLIATSRELRLKPPVANGDGPRRPVPLEDPPRAPGERSIARSDPPPAEPGGTAVEGRGGTGRTGSLVPDAKAVTVDAVAGGGGGSISKSGPAPGAKKAVATVEKQGAGPSVASGKSGAPGKTVAQVQGGAQTGGAPSRPPPEGRAHSDRRLITEDSSAPTYEADRLAAQGKFEDARAKYREVLKLADEGKVSREVKRSAGEKLVQADAAAREAAGRKLAPPADPRGISAEDEAVIIEAILNSQDPRRIAAIKKRIRSEVEKEMQRLNQERVRRGEPPLPPDKLKPQGDYDNEAHLVHGLAHLEPTPDPFSLTIGKGVSGKQTVIAYETDSLNDLPSSSERARQRQFPHGTNKGTKGTSHFRQVAVIRQLDDHDLEAAAEVLASEILARGGRRGPITKIIEVGIDGRKVRYLVTKQFEPSVDWEKLSPSNGDKLGRKQDLAEDLVYRLLLGDGDVHFGNFRIFDDGSAMGFDFGAADLFPSHPRYRNPAGFQEAVNKVAAYRAKLTELAANPRAFGVTRSAVDEAKRALGKFADTLRVDPLNPGDVLRYTKFDAALKDHYALVAAFKDLKGTGLERENLTKVFNDGFVGGLYQHPNVIGNPENFSPEEFQQFVAGSMEAHFQHAVNQWGDGEGIVQSAINPADFNRALDEIETRVAPKVDEILERLKAHLSPAQQEYTRKLLHERVKQLRSFMNKKFPPLTRVGAHLRRPIDFLSERSEWRLAA